MPQSILRLEPIFVENIVVWNMTIVANRYVAMRTVCPVIELGIHYMAINTGFGIIGKIGNSPRNIQGIGPQTKKNAQQDRDGALPLFRGDQPKENLLHAP